MTSMGAWGEEIEIAANDGWRLVVVVDSDDLVIDGGAYVQIDVTTMDRDVATGTRCPLASVCQSMAMSPVDLRDAVIDAYPRAEGWDVDLRDAVIDAYPRAEGWDWASETGGGCDDGR